MIKISTDGDKITVVLDNGHVEALKKIVEDYNLKGEEQALGFMLSVISEGKGKPIEVNGTSYIPAQSIKKSPESQFTTDNPSENGTTP